MATMTTALVGDDVVTIEDALASRDHARFHKIADPKWRCIECGESVRPHSDGGHASAHFEHLERNGNCSLSHVMR